MTSDLKDKLLVREEDAIRLVLEFLSNRDLSITQLSLERESGIYNCQFSDDLIFLRQLILDGQWEDALQFVSPLESFETFSSKRFRFLIYKHKYVELLCIRSEAGSPLQTVEVAVQDIIECLDKLEKYCSDREEYNHLSSLLTIPDLNDDDDLKNWNPNNWRLKCFTDLLPLVEKFMPANDQDARLKKMAKNDRLMDLIFKGLLYEVCLVTVEQKIKKSDQQQPQPQQQKKRSEVVDDVEFKPDVFNGITERINLGHLFQLMPDRYLINTQSNDNEPIIHLDIAKHHKPSLVASWSEMILSTPIKPQVFPHIDVPYTRIKASDLMSKSLSASLMHNNVDNIKDLMTMSVCDIGQFTRSTLAATGFRLNHANNNNNNHDNENDLNNNNVKDVVVCENVGTIAKDHPYVDRRDNRDVDDIDENSNNKMTRSIERLFLKHSDNVSKSTFIGVPMSPISEQATPVEDRNEIPFSNVINHDGDGNGDDDDAAAIMNKSFLEIYQNSNREKHNQNINNTKINTKGTKHHHHQRTSTSTTTPTTTLALKNREESKKLAKNQRLSSLSSTPSSATRPANPKANNNNHHHHCGNNNNNVECDQTQPWQEPGITRSNLITTPITKGNKLIIGNPVANQQQQQRRWQQEPDHHHHHHIKPVLMEDGVQHVDDDEDEDDDADDVRQQMNQKFNNLKHGIRNNSPTSTGSTSSDHNFNHSHNYSQSDLSSTGGGGGGASAGGAGYDTTNSNEDANDVHFIPIIKIKDQQAIRTADFHPTGQYYAVGSNSKLLRIFRYSSQDLTTKDDGNKFNRSLLLELTESEEIHCRTNYHKGSIYCLAWNKLGTLLATGSNDKTVKLLPFNQDAIKFSPNEAEITAHDGTVRDVCFMDDLTNGSSLLLSGGAGDCKVYITDCETATTFLSLSGHSGPILSMFTWGGAMFVSGSQDRTIRFWDLRTNSCINFVTCPTISRNKPGGAVAAVCVDPSGKLLVSGHEDSTCMLYDIRGGRVIQTFHPHASDIRSIRFSNKEYYLLTGGYDNKIALTDLKGDLTQPLQSMVVASHQDKVIQCRWHPNEFTFLSTSADKSVVLWTLPD